MDRSSRVSARETLLTALAGLCSLSLGLLVAWPGPAETGSLDAFALSMALRVGLLSCSLVVFAVLLRRVVERISRRLDRRAPAPMAGARPMRSVAVSRRSAA